jgi:ASC-1-like (ASCH) protein
MSRFEKDKSILNLSKKMKREIEKTQFDQQLTILFIDVNRSFSYVYEDDCAEMFVIKNNRRIAQALRNLKCFYEKSKSNRFRCRACARRS